MAVDAGILEGKKMLLHSESGSGKTLAYLMPILESMYKLDNLTDMRVQMDKSNEAIMFQNADELYHRLKTLKTTQISRMKGALVLTYSKELVSQVYVQARLLDYTQQIRVNRLTSSLQMKTPIVEFITPDSGSAKSENEGKDYTPEDLFDISMSNVINNASWNLSDILVASPMTMAHVLKDRNSYAPFDINPRVIVIDECDLLLDSDLEKKVVEVIQKFATKIGPFAEENKKRQFIFSCSTLPQSIVDKIQDWFPDLEIVKSPNAHMINPALEIKTLSLKSEDNDLDLLAQVIKPNEQTIIFCDKKTKIEKVCEHLQLKEIKNLPFHEEGKMNAQMRNATLSLYLSGKLPVMVCNNLAARGLDLPNTQHVIQFDYAKTPADYLHRVGRVGRLGQPGRVTNFIRKGDQQLSASLASQDLDELILNSKRK